MIGLGWIIFISFIAIWELIYIILRSIGCGFDWWEDKIVSFGVTLVAGLIITIPCSLMWDKFGYKSILIVVGSIIGIALFFLLNFLLSEFIEFIKYHDFNKKKEAKKK